MKTKLAALVAAAIFSTGCATPHAETPQATNFPSSKQQKLQAASHWNTIAKDVAAKLGTTVPKSAALYVSPQPKQTVFDRAFTNLLITALIDAGHPVLKSAQGALEVTVETQPVAFAPNRPRHQYVGGATALGAGVWVLYDIVEHASSGAGKAALLSLGAYDALTWFQSEFASGATPSTEIIVTTSVADANRYLARATSVYYVADSDSELYTPEPPKHESRTKTFQLTGDAQ